MTKEIYLGNSSDTVLVDDGDFEALRPFGWNLSNGGHAKATIKRKSIFMHRLILQAPSGSEVDHVNGNGLDNRRENLRLCTRAENAANRRLAINNTSGFKGVTWDARMRKYQAQIHAHGTNIYLGVFSTAAEAAAAYDIAAGQHFGEFANTNF